MTAHHTSIRAFLAIDIPNHVREEIATIIHYLRQTIRHQEIRWIPPEKTHITLQFFKQLNETHIPILIQMLEKEFASIHPFRLSLSLPTLFPTSYQPRVLIIGVKNTSDLEHVVKVIRHTSKLLEYPIEKRPFIAHISIGRIESKKPFFLKNLPMFKLDTIQVKEIVLFQSQQTPEGTKYLPLKQIALTV